MHSMQGEYLEPVLTVCVCLLVACGTCEKASVLPLGTATVSLCGHFLSSHQFAKCGGTRLVILFDLLEHLTQLITLPVEIFSSHTSRTLLNVENLFFFPT